MSRLTARHMHHSKTTKEILDIIIFRIIPIFAIIVFIMMQNKYVAVHDYVYSSPLVPKTFVGYKIAHVSDICNSSLDASVKIQREHPDIIVITGGYSDNAGNNQNTILEISKLAKIAPVYYIYGTEDAGNELNGINGTDITDKVITLQPDDLSTDEFIIKNYGRSALSAVDKENNISFEEQTDRELKAAVSSNVVLAGLPSYKDNNVDAAYSDASQIAADTDKAAYRMVLMSNYNTIENINKLEFDTIFMGGTFGMNTYYNNFKKGMYVEGSTEYFINSGLGNTTGKSRILNYPSVQIITLSDGTVSSSNPLKKMLEKISYSVETTFGSDNRTLKETTTNYDNDASDYNVKPHTYNKDIQ